MIKHPATEMPVENDTSHQNGQDSGGGGGGGGGNGNVSTETTSQPQQQATEPNATTTIVNGTHPKVASTTADEPLAQETPKDAKKVKSVVICNISEPSMCLATAGGFKLGCGCTDKCCFVQVS